ncbi:MAG: prolyl oligopeptidase family serine peptidase, partial [Propionicimonas sp.]
LYLSDASGFWNFQRWDGRATRELHPASHDFCGPLWVLAPVPYTVIDAGRIGCTWLVDGSARLGVLDFEADGPGPGRLTEVSSEAVAAALSGTGPVTLALLGYPTRPAELVELDWDTGDQTTLLRAAPSGLDPAMVARARPFSWESPDGPVHGWYYPPTHSGVVPPEGVSPPVQVWSHGGPTAFSTPGFEIAVQFWTTRGIGILDVNYSGSAGYGRAYRERLRGNWGVADVRDCVAGAQALVAAGLADPDRLSIRGSSAGGFTTLAALTGSEVFAAGISLYGIGDLEALVRDSHKFEAHYLDGLIAPYPAGREIYRERSPLHHLDRLNCPMLILQGRKDTVVPPSQAQALADAVQSRGLAAELIWFDDEGHGFRRAESIIATAEAALAFLGRVHGFDPA